MIIIFFFFGEPHQKSAFNLWGGKQGFPGVPLGSFCDKIQKKKKKMGLSLGPLSYCILFFFSASAEVR